MLCWSIIVLFQEAQYKKVMSDYLTSGKKAM